MEFLPLLANKSGWEDPGSWIKHCECFLKAGEDLISVKRGNCEASWEELTVDPEDLNNCWAIWNISFWSNVFKCMVVVQLYVS